MTDREQEHLLATATDRFERRLAEEIASVRVAMIEQGRTLGQEIAALRNDMVEQRSEARQDIAALRTDVVTLNSENRQEIADLRVRMTEQFAAAEKRHHELLKWAFVFWVGQAVFVTTIIAALE